MKESDQLKKGNKRNGIIGLLIMLVLAIVVILGSGPLYRAIDNGKNGQTNDSNANEDNGSSPNGNESASNESQENESNTNEDSTDDNHTDENKDNAKFKDGTYETETDYDEKGYKDTMKMVVAGGRITGLEWDNVDQDGNSKAQASLDGEYVMTEDGLTWARQAELLADYVITNGTVTGLSMDENGKTDTISGVSISISGFVELAAQLLEQAGGTAAAALKDGSYHVEGTLSGDTGYQDVVDMVVSGGVITELSWDEVGDNGIGKVKLSMEGEYIMTEDGLTWAEQAKLLADYVIQNQDLSGLDVNDEGKTDTIAGVSISINGFIAMVEEALKQATN